MEVFEKTGPRPNRRRDTPHGYHWILRGLRFKREYDAATTELAKESVATTYPDIFWAHWVWSSANPLKHSVEAHILAREEDSEIGFRCNLTPDVVQAYESLFFNVREKIDHRKYIINCVFGPTIHKGFSEREFDLIWKLYGYFLGPYVLDLIEDKFPSSVWCGTPEGARLAIADDAVTTLKLKSALAAKTVAVNAQTQMALIDQFTRFEEIERNSDSQGKAQEQILENIHAMLTGLPFSVNGINPKTGKAIEPGPISEFDSGSVELTYEETMRICVRQPIANADTLREMVFPQGPATILDAT